jgi:hypothetical protein
MWVGPSYRCPDPNPESENDQFSQTGQFHLKYVELHLRGQSPRRGGWGRENRREQGEVLAAVPVLLISAHISSFQCVYIALKGFFALAPELRAGTGWHS